MPSLRELHEAATPAPWSKVETEEECGVAGPTFDGEDLDLICWDGWPQDAALIAAMRNDLPLLLDVVELAAEVMADDGLPWRPEYGCFFCPATNAPHEDGCLWAETKAALAALGGAA